MSNREYQQTTRAPIHRDVRRFIMERENYLCSYCGEPSEDWHIDHVIPLSRGGSNSIHNLALACPPCNMSKGGSLMAEWEDKQKLTKGTKLTLGPFGRAMYGGKRWYKTMADDLGVSVAHMGKVIIADKPVTHAMYDDLRKLQEQREVDVLRWRNEFKVPIDCPQDMRMLIIHGRC